MTALLASPHDTHNTPFFEISMDIFHQIIHKSNFNSTTCAFSLFIDTTYTAAISLHLSCNIPISKAMGGCFSSVRLGSAAAGTSNSNPSAKVISINGDLRQYPAPVLVSHVLAAETSTSSSSSSSSLSENNVFICNSDSLYFDQVIPALEMEDQLQPNHMYFVLPSSKRERPLSSSDMAALAVKASLALSLKDGRRRHRKYSRICPLSFVNGHKQHHHDDHHDDDQGIQYDDQDYYLTIGSTKKKKAPSAASGSTTPLGTSRSGSVRKLQRLTSRRAKLAVRSFRLRLTTIYEGTIL